jgi:hypothetical protein
LRACDCDLAGNGSGLGENRVLEERAAKPNREGAGAIFIRNPRELSSYEWDKRCNRTGGFYTIEFSIGPAVEALAPDSLLPINPAASVFCLLSPQ